MRNKHEPAFWQFHKENPHVYATLERLAFRLRNKGVQRWGIKALWEVLRYEMAVATNADVSDYKLNNNHCPYYARLLMEKNPDDLAAFFELRERKPQGVDSPDLPE